MKTRRSFSRRIVLAGLLLAVLLLVPAVVPSNAHAARGVRYELTAKSQFQSGCFAPCECPIGVEEPVRGRFLLVRTGTQDGGLFESFAVRSVRWTIGDGPAASVPTKKVTGRGTYLLGGEVAVTQRLELDLSIDGAPPQHFDSGFVLTGAPFPEIAATISMNGMVCFDNVFTIDAVPAPTIRAAQR